MTSDLVWDRLTLWTTLSLPPLMSPWATGTAAVLTGSTTSTPCTAAVFSTLCASWEPRDDMMTLFGPGQDVGGDVVKRDGWQRKKGSRTRGRKPSDICHREQGAMDPLAPGPSPESRRPQGAPESQNPTNPEADTPLPRFPRGVGGEGRALGSAAGESGSVICPGPPATIWLLRGCLRPGLSSTVER